MKFDIPKIVRPLELKDYAPEYGVTISVWVNPPVKLLQEHDRILNDVRAGLKDSAVEGHSALGVIEHAANELIVVFAELWSQGAPDTHWTDEEVRKLVDETQETDPQLWPWLRNRTMEMIREHRNQLKKSLTPALLSLAEGRGTNHPMLSAIWLARKINEQHGGAIVAAWNVYDLPWEWIDAVTGMGINMPAMAEGKQKVENVLERWRQAHPQYKRS